MKNQLFTKHSFLGILMGLVLVFSVQGIVEALTITQTSSPVESKPHGSSFDLKINVGVKGNTVAYHPTYSSRRINADDHTGPDYQYIDSQGYEVTYIAETSRSYRNTTGTPEGTLTVDQPRYDANNGGAAATAPTSPYLVDTSGNVYDINGKAVYVQTGAGTKDDPSTTDTNEHDPWVYKRAKATPNTKVANASALHDYNDEAIGITISGGGTLELKNRGYTFVTATKPSTEADYDGTTYALKERVDIGLPSSMTLVYTGASVGTHTIEIWDATPTTDFPLVGGPGPNRPRSSKTFTIYVTPTTTTIPDNTDITPDNKRVPVVADEPQKVSEPVFTFPTNGNYRIQYEVFRGNGKLYVGTFEKEFTTPAQTLLVHQSSTVWINMNGTSNEVHLSFAGEDRSTARARVVFEYRGKDLPGRNTGDTSDTTQTTQTTRGSLNIDASGSGNTREITVTARNAAGTPQSGISVLLNVSNGATLSQRSGPTPLTSTLTLPATAGDYVLTATTTADYTGDTETIPVTLPGNLGLALIGEQVNGSQTVQVTARTAGGTLETTPVLVSLTGAGTSRTVTVTGSQNVPIVLPTASGTLTASATGYNSGSVTLPARSTTTTTTPTTPTTGPAGVADSIVIDGSRTLDGTLAEATRLRTRVLDANDRGVSEVAVTFRVLSPGRGTFAGARGSGRAIRLDTDRNGYATVNFTPTTEGDVIVEAKAAKVTAAVTFILDVGESATTTTPDTTTPTTTTPATTTPDPADVTLKVGAAKRPVMYWITGGALYRQGTGDATQITASAKDVVVDTAGGKLYWIEQQTERTGAIHSANLDGSNAKVVKTLTSAPMGLALDTANKKLYLTNGWGKVQRINTDGTQFATNFITGLAAPMHVAVAGGNVYWTEGDGSVMSASLQGGKNIQTLVSGSGGLGGIAADAKNVYWTETTGQRSGRIRAANLNGAGVRDMYTITATVHGLAIDPATNRPYWTNGWGKVQRGLSNGKIQDVVTGLPTPTALAIGGANAATDATPTKPATPKTAANKYDVNGDGTVDVKDSDALIVAVAAGVTDAKYDVNGDGKVDINDVIAVTANRNGGAAGAPTLLGMKFSALEVDRLQEQIDLLIATNDRSPAAMRTLVYLQQLIVMARPEKTQLLANYPNPFNPETWIPYELATDTDVTLTIYNAQGVVVRVLHLGQQSAGYYTDRERAAYWDGRNSQGEQVASGVYFYQLETDEMSALRKMVILK